MNLSYCIVHHIFSKTPVEPKKKTIWEKNILGFKNKKSIQQLPPQQHSPSGWVVFFRSHPGGNAAGGGLMEAELES